MSEGRMKGVSVVKPIVYGNIARPFGKKRETDGHTHQWTVYLKPWDNEDMSAYVKRVTFKLHDSYNDSNRVVTNPPYEVTETGWGEFEVAIKVQFVDPAEKTVTVFCLLKLFQTEPADMSGRNYLVAEHYDEIVFNDPSPMMYQLLTNTRPLTLGPHKHDTDFDDHKKDHLVRILNGKKSVRSDISRIRDQLQRDKDLIHRLRAEVEKLEKKSS